MALKAFDKTFGTFNTGDVVVIESYGTQYAQKLIKKVFVDELGDYRFIGVEGKVKNGEFKQDGVEPYLSLFSTKALRGNYTSKLVPGVEVAPGDILRDVKTSGMFLVESRDKVWNLSEGTQTSYENWESRYSKKFVLQTTAGGSKFSTYVKYADFGKK